MTDIAKKPASAKKKVPAPGRRLSRQEALEKALKKFPETLSKLAK